MTRQDPITLAIIARRNQLGLSRYMHAKLAGVSREVTRRADAGEGDYSINTARRLAHVVGLTLELKEVDQ